jgi:hypothetical protein
MEKITSNAFESIDLHKGVRAEGQVSNVFIAYHISAQRVMETNARFIATKLARTGDDALLSAGAVRTELVENVDQHLKMLGKFIISGESAILTPGKEDSFEGRAVRALQALVPDFIEERRAFGGLRKKLMLGAHTDQEIRDEVQTMIDSRILTSVARIGNVKDSIFYPEATASISLQRAFETDL